MSYCTVLEARERMPEIEDPKWDSEVEGCIEQAETEINDKLKPAGVTVPLTTVPDSVKHICADIAAAIFRSRRVADGKMPALYDKAHNKLDAYIGRLDEGGGFLRV